MSDKTLCYKLSPNLVFFCISPCYFSSNCIPESRLAGRWSSVSRSSNPRALLCARCARSNRRLMNKYHDFRRRDRNPNPASTARQTQRIDKNSSRTARRHKYSNKGRLCVVEPPSERFVSRMHTVWCTRLSFCVWVCVSNVKEKS